MVSAVKSIFRINVSGCTLPCIQFSIISIPAPLYAWEPMRAVARITKHPPAKMRRYGFLKYFLYKCSAKWSRTQNKILTKAHKIARSETFPADAMPNAGKAESGNTSFATPKESAIWRAVRELITQGRRAV